MRGAWLSIEPAGCARIFAYAFRLTRPNYVFLLAIRQINSF